MWPSSGELDGLPFIHPFDDYDVAAWQGTVGLEILSSVLEPLEYIRWRQLVVELS
ncbi:MAG: hypothetical protein IPO94_05935 [Saprospiraceae bacterium]|nr:hypothetical protein [Saprospiraceae bacterium]